VPRPKRPVRIGGLLQPRQRVWRERVYRQRCLALQLQPYGRPLDMQQHAFLSRHAMPVAISRDETRQLRGHISVSGDVGALEDASAYDVIPAEAQSSMTNGDAACFPLFHGCTADTGG